MTKLIAMIANIIDISSVSINIHCYNMHFTSYQRKNLKEDFFPVQMYHDLSFVTEFYLAA